METRFATIFAPCNTPFSDNKQISYKLICVAFVGCDKNKFIVKTGPFEGNTHNDFDILKAPDSFIFNHPKKVVITSTKNNFKIHIFKDKFIEQLKEEQQCDNAKVYAYIAKKLSDMKFTPFLNKIYKSEKPNFMDYAFFPPFNDEVVNIMLYGQNPQKLDNSKGNKLMVMNAQDSMPLLELEEENIKKKERYDIEQIDVKKIIQDIESKIVGQNEAIETLVSNIYYNQVLINNLEKNNTLNSSELDSRKVSILLDGSTGTGKTAIAKEIASKLNLPIEIVNANSFSETGYVGPTITDILKKLLKKANGDLNIAERGIVVLDEIDKIAGNTNYIGRDMKQGVQEELLSFIGGGKYDLSSGNPFSRGQEFDTSKLTFIMSGAFTKLKEEKIKEQESNKIGFTDDSNKTDKSYTLTPQDYIDYGLMRELFGRIKVLTYTKTYSKDDLKTILLKSEISPLKNFEKTVKMFGHEGIIYNNIFIDKLVEEAYNMETGARSLQTIMSEIQNEMLTELIVDKKEDYIELDEDTIKSYQKRKIRKY